MAIKPQSSKAKGRRLQQAVRDALLEAFPTLEPDDIKSTSMGAGGEDVMLSPAARRLFPYQIECKSKAASQLHTYYEQAKTHGKHEPLVIVKKDRDVTLACVEWSHFLELIKDKNADTGKT
jgi:hypothetical protein